MNKWIRRKRNSLGYGVQSPNDFHFVRHVLREKSPYYAYATLDGILAKHGGQSPSYPDAIHRLLFRLSNYVHPNTVIEVGAGPSIFAMAMACPSARCIAVAPATEHLDTMVSMQTTFPNVEIRKDDELVLFSQSLHELQAIDILHVGHTSRYREVVEAALPYVTDRTLFIIEGIHDCKEKRDWWKSLQGSPSTGISYDLKSVGLLFFDRTRHKNTYWINLRD